VKHAALVEKPWFADLLKQSQFLARYPAYAHLVAQMDPMATDQVSSMAIARHLRADGQLVLRLYVNVDYFGERPDFFGGILQHEIQHVVCGHLDSASLHQVEQPRLMELAMEMSANENIVEPMPPGFVWQDFTAFGCASGQSTVQRYRRLFKAHRDGHLKLMTAEQLDAMDPKWRTRGGRGGGFSGTRPVILPSRRSILPWHNNPSVVNKNWRDEHRPGSCTRGDGRGLGDAIDRNSDGARSKTWRDRAWGLGRPTNEDQIKEWQLRIRQHLRGELGGDGDGQRAGPRAAKELPRRVAVASLDGRLAWPAILRQLLPSSRNVTPTYMRPNRRFPERLGELPGRVRRPRRPNVLVGIDTSACMSAQDLARVRAELKRIQRHANCTFAECDAAVHRVHRDAHVEMVTGGGDTDFRSMFDLLAQRTGFDAAVYFTDGVGMWPEVAPGVPVLWALIDDRAFDCPWGTVVRVP